MAAPWVFVTLAVLFGGGGWAIGRFMYGERIETLKGRIEAGDEKIAAFEAERSKPKPVEADKPPQTLSTHDVSDAVLGPPAMRRRVASAIKDPEALRDRLTRQRWTFYFSPAGNNGSKSLSFRPDGSIGEGRNENEHNWVFEGDRLAIYRRNGDLQNVFRYSDSGRFEYVFDVRAVGFKHQYLVPA